MPVFSGEIHQLNPKKLNISFYLKKEQVIKLVNPERNQVINNFKGRDLYE